MPHLDHRPARRSPWLVLLTLALALPLLTDVAPARAEERADDARGHDLRALADRAAAEDPSLAGAGGDRGFADAQCVPDAAGTTFRIDGDGREVATTFPRADLREHCADYGTTLTLQLRTSEPTDPAADLRWRGETTTSATQALWFLDTGDGFDFVAILRHDGEQPVAEVVELGPTGDDDVLRCTGTPAFVEGSLVVAGLDPATCFDAPDRIVVSPVMAYDADPEDPDAPVHLDVAANRNAVGRTGAVARRTGMRLAGESRIDTAIAIAGEQFPDGAQVAYLARADAFPDALAAGSLTATARTRGPVLLVPSCGDLPPTVLTEIERLDPARITVLGGSAAVCDEVLAAAAAAGRADDPRTSDRLAGSGRNANRYGTAVAISQRAYLSGRVADVYLATGQTFPDALASSALTDGPTLLIPSCGSIPEVVAEEIRRLDPVRIVALGGTRAVCNTSLLAAAEVPQDEPQREIGRLAGPSRFDTAVSVARFQFPDGATQVVLARADAFPDALAAGPLEGGPVLLVPSCGDLPPEVARVIRDLAPDRVIALGGQTAVCEAMLRHAANA